MTQEQIEKKAKAYANEFSEEHEYYDEYEDGKKFGMESGFKAGANWRINSVWHKPEEKPEESEDLLTLNALNIPTLYQRGYLGDWYFLVKEYGIVKWAYINDLLPEEE